MNRHDFLAKFGIGLAVVCTGTCLSSCEKEEVKVDFTLDLTSNDYKALQTVGGSTIKDKVIIARVDTNTFAAVALACTHNSTSVAYQSANKRFHCPNHGSNFGTDGKVLNGPASSALTKYNTTLSGNLLRVFS